MKAIKKSFKRMLQVQTQTVRQLAHLVGVLKATRLAVIPAPLHYCGLQAIKKSGLGQQLVRNLGWKELPSFSWVGKRDGHHNGRPIHMTPPADPMHPTACHNNQRTAGQWSHEEARTHINVKELLAIFLALQSFVGSRRGINENGQIHLRQQHGGHASKFTQVYNLFQGKVMDFLRLARMRGLGKFMEGESHDSISLAHNLIGSLMFCWH